MSKLFLLSVEEAEKIPQEILACDSWWWLRSPGGNSIYAMKVDYDGYARSNSYVYSAYNAVRPALFLSSPLSELNLKRSKKGYIKLGNKENGKSIEWIDISEYMGKPCLLTKKPIGQFRFDEKSNDYDKSEIKATLAELDNILFTDLEKSLLIAD